MKYPRGFWRAWFKQLRLLLWKNFTLRLRHWIRSLLELLVPLVLFVVLAFVRLLLDTRELYGYCHFEDKALPSTGVSAMLQNYICTFNNTCYENSPDTKFRPVFAHSNDFLKFENAAELLAEFEALKDMFGNLTQSTTNETFKLVAEKICGFKLQDPPKISGGRSSGYTYHVRSSQEDSAKRDVDNCKKVLYDLVPGVPGLTIVLDHIMPFILGKILYTPDDAPYRTVISYANETFQTIAGLREMVSIFNLTNQYLEVLNCFDANKFLPVGSEEELVRLSQEHYANETFLGAIVFNTSSVDGSNNNANVLPSHVHFKIRLPSSRIDTEFYDFGVYNPKPERGEVYWHSFFLWMQEMIEHAIIRTHSPNATLPSITLKQMPSPCYFEDPFLITLSTFFPFFMIVSFLFPFMVLVKKIVIEKERCLVETMKIMGMMTSAYWTSWFLESFASWSLAVIIIVVIIKVSNLISGNVLIVYLLLTAYIIATINFAFLVSTLCNRASIAAYAAGLIFLFTYFIKTALQRLQDQRNVGVGVKISLSLISNVAFAYGSEGISSLEKRGYGVQWDDVDPSSDDKKMTIAASMGMLILDAVIYMLLALCIQTYFPGEFGQGKRCCCNWFTRRGKEGAVAPQPESSNIQSGTESLEIGVALKRVTKRYGAAVVVEDLSLCFYKNQITTLLGYNGAGKTSILSMIVGLIPLSSGTILIEGRDIAVNLDEARAIIGYCPQQNNLFDQLTVMEHLKFYSSLKSSYDGMKSEIEGMLVLTKLDAARHKIAEHLSGGMKRKLSVLIAFLGGSKVIVLDESTAGLDPGSRQDIMKLLYARKQNHTIVMSTHIMEEADSMSDRIAIVHRGKLKCAGSPMFLKKQFGSGYRLTVAWDKSGNAEAAKPVMLKFLRGFLRQASLAKESAFELEFLLPKEDQGNYEGKLASLFRALEKRRQSIAISSYGITGVNMEDAFLVATGSSEQPPETVGDKDRHNRQAVAAAQGPVAHFAKTVFALEIRRLHYAKRSISGILCELIIPILLVLFTVTVINVRLKRGDEFDKEIDPRHINTWKLQGYAEEVKELVFSANFSDDFDILLGVEDNFFSNISYGTQCLSEYAGCTGYPPDITNFAWNSSTYQQIGRLNQYCQCDTGKQVCNYDGIYPPSALLPTGDVIYNLTTWNTTDFLLLTERPSIERRFGGYELNERALEPLIANVSATPEGGHVRIWFQSKGINADASYLNALNNVILRSAVNDSSEFGISLFNHPIKVLPTLNETERKMKRDQKYAFEEIVSVQVAMSLVPASFLRFYVEEKTLNVKHLQYMSGVTPLAYWTSAFVWDMSIFSVTAWLCIAIFAAYDLEYFTGAENFGPVVLIFYLYGWAVINFAYLSSFYFRSPTTAMIVTACYYLLIGYISTVVTYILELSGRPDLEEVGKILKKVFLVFPQYCFGRSLLDLSFDDIRSKLLEKYGFVAETYNIYDIDILGGIIISLALQGFLFLTLTLLLDYSRHCHCTCSSIKAHGHGHGRGKSLKVDADVLQEEKRILENAERDEDGTGDILVVKNLTKCYNTSDEPAVNDLTFGIRRGECLGLVGLNGAGKSTTLKILTGDLYATSGTVSFLNRDLLSSSQRSEMGYCPQDNALSPLLTVKETLMFYARVHGFKEVDLEEIASESMKSLALESSANKCAYALSGGTKRKLLLATALLGNPRLLLLDEASTGMDPYARKFLIKSIEQCRRRQQAVLIVSHLMQECDVLCNRIAVMKRGQFICMGSPQQLKDSYGSSTYTITLKLKQGDESAIGEMKSQVSKKLPSAEQVDDGFSQITFKLHLNQIRLHEVFERLEELRATSKNLEDYMVSQLSLNEVFLNELSISTSKDETQCRTMLNNKHGTPR